MEHEPCNKLFLYGYYDSDQWDTVVLLLITGYGVLVGSNRATQTLAVIKIRGQQSMSATPLMAIGYGLLYSTGYML